jgi:erythritol transport system substrate-binding protein
VIIVSTAIARHAVAIVLDNASADARMAAVEKATKAGIPVFLVDREINAKGIAKTQIVSNNFQGATLAATYLAQLMGQRGNLVELTGKDSDTNAHVRSDDYHSILDKFPAMKMVARQTANWDQNEAYNVTQTILQAHPSIKGVICGNDTMAIGAEAALLAANRPGVIVTSFDGSPDAVTSILKGPVKATVLQPIVQLSINAVDEADQFLKTGSTGMDEKQTVNCVLITKDNASHLNNFVLSSGL